MQHLFGLQHPLPGMSSRYNTIVVARLGHGPVCMWLELATGRTIFLLAGIVQQSRVRQNSNIVTTLLRDCLFLLTILTGDITRWLA